MDRASRFAVECWSSSIRTRRRCSSRRVQDSRLLADTPDAELGMRTVTIAVPRGLSTRDGLKRLHKVAPAIQSDFDHLYEPAGG